MNRNILEDRVIFSPGPMAIGKGCVYLMAFLTAVFFITPNERAYIFGIIIYSCGCVFDYIETACKREKSKFVRQTAAILAIMIIVVGVVAFGMAVSYEISEDVKNFICNYYKAINFFLVLFWFLPLKDGVWLIMKSIGNSSEAEEKGDIVNKVSGFLIKP